MNIVSTIRPLMTFAKLGSLLAAVACGGTAEPRGGETKSSVNAATKCAGEDEGAEDKLTCSEDPECDADEFCLTGKCVGSDGDAEGDACDADEEEGVADKLSCSANADCDADEVCSAGKCAGLPDPCSADSDCDADEACTNGNCDDR